MQIPYFQVDVFTRKPFGGNPAGVCLLPGDWLPDPVMQAIAFENHLSETAFVTRRGDGWGLRWFTPEIEMDLCGHATVAPAHVLIHETKQVENAVTFETRSGPVSVTRNGDVLILDFPARPPAPTVAPANLMEAMGARPETCLKSRDYLLVYDREETVRRLNPDFRLLKAWDALGIIVTAPGDTADFVSRFFAPAAGVDEDPVTGSAHATLIPYWASRLGKSRLQARQISRRGGELLCEQAGERVLIGGHAVTWFRGSIELP